MRRALAIACLASTCLLAGVAPAAGASPAKVEIGKVRPAVTPAGRPALLVPVTYPIEMAGRLVQLTAKLHDGDGTVIRAWMDRRISHAGPLRTPERRRHFVWVHRIGIDAAAAAELRAGNRLYLAAKANYNPDRDSGREHYWLDSDTQEVPLAGGGLICSSLPKRRVRPGGTVVVPLPLCNRDGRWSISDRPELGTARIRGDSLIYRPAKGFRGTASIQLVLGPNGAITP